MSESEKEYKTIVDRWEEEEDGLGFPDEEPLEEYAARVKKERTPEAHI